MTSATALVTSQCVFGAKNVSNVDLGRFKSSLINHQARSATGPQGVHASLEIEN